MFHSFGCMNLSKKKFLQIYIQWHFYGIEEKLNNKNTVLHYSLHCQWMEFYFTVEISKAEKNAYQLNRNAHSLRMWNILFEYITSSEAFASLRLVSFFFVCDIISGSSSLLVLLMVFNKFQKFSTWPKFNSVPQCVQIYGFHSFIHLESEYNFFWHVNFSLPVIIVNLNIDQTSAEYLRERKKGHHKLNSICFFTHFSSRHWFYRDLDAKFFISFNFTFPLSLWISSSTFIREH